MTVNGNYFYGNEISNYGKENGYVDYATFAKAFDAVLANDLMSKTDGVAGYWEDETEREPYYEDSKGNRYTEDERDELLEKLEERYNNLQLCISDAEERFEYRDEDIFPKMQEWEKEADEIDDDMLCLQDEQYDHESEVFQWYIIDDNGARICKESGEIVYYNEELDLYLWGVTHWGTAWDYVLTDIKIVKG